MIKVTTVESIFCTVYTQFSLFLSDVFSRKFTKILLIFLFDQNMVYGTVVIFLNLKMLLKLRYFLNLFQTLESFTLSLEKAFLTNFG